MKECPVCFKQFDDNEKYCSECGGGLRSVYDSVPKVRSVYDSVPKEEKMGQGEQAFFKKSDLSEKVCDEIKQGSYYVAEEIKGSLFAICMVLLGIFILKSIFTEEIIEKGKYLLTISDCGYWYGGAIAFLMFGSLFFLIVAAFNTASGVTYLVSAILSGLALMLFCFYPGAYQVQIDSSTVVSLSSTGGMIVWGLLVYISLNIYMFAISR